MFIVQCRPQNVPRLFDLVVPKDPKYSTAFYFALRDMLIADTLDQATKIGLQVHVPACICIETCELCSSH